MNHGDLMIAMLALSLMSAMSQHVFRSAVVSLLFLIAGKMLGW